MQREVVETLLHGEPPPTFLDRLDATNARNTQLDREASKASVIDRLNAASFRMELLLGRLTAGQLVTPISLPDDSEGRPLLEIVRGGVLGHPAGHFAEMREATSWAG